MTTEDIRSHTRQIFCNN